MDDDPAEDIANLDDLDSTSSDQEEFIQTRRSFVADLVSSGEEESAPSRRSFEVDPVSSDDGESVPLGARHKPCPLLTCTERTPLETIHYNRATKGSGSAISWTTSIAGTSDARRVCDYSRCRVGLSTSLLRANTYPGAIRDASCRSIDRATSRQRVRIGTRRLRLGLLDAWLLPGVLPAVRLRRGQRRSGFPFFALSPPATIGTRTT